MDIFKILTESRYVLLKEDLDCLESEVLTSSEFDSDYKKKCTEIIKSIRKERFDLSNENKNIKQNFKDYSLLVSNETLQSASKPKNEISKETEEQRQQNIQNRFFEKLNMFRKKANYKTAFKQIARETPNFDFFFVKNNFEKFNIYELDIILEIMQMNEDFLENNFDVLNKISISKYQRISENFFMKHFNELDSNAVLNNKKNAWREKEKMSKQLEVFLRIKGIHL